MTRAVKMVGGLVVSDIPEQIRAITTQHRSGCMDCFVCLNIFSLSLINNVYINNCFSLSYFCCKIQCLCK